MVRLGPQRVSWICKVVTLEDVGTPREAPTGLFLEVWRGRKQGGYPVWAAQATIPASPSPTFSRSRCYHGSLLDVAYQLLIPTFEPPPPHSPRDFSQAPGTATALTGLECTPLPPSLTLKRTPQVPPSPEAFPSLSICFGCFAQAML